MSLPSIGIISELVFVTANVYNCRSHSQPCKKKKKKTLGLTPAQRRKRRKRKKEEEEEDKKQKWFQTTFIAEGCTTFTTQIRKYNSITKSGTEAMVQWLSTFVAFTEDLISVPNTHIRQPSTTCDFSSKESDALF